MTANDAITDQVRDKYAQAARSVLEATDSTAETAGCCSPADGAGFSELLYDATDRASLPDAAVLASLGCGNPIAVADLVRDGVVGGHRRLLSVVVSGGAAVGSDRGGLAGEPRLQAGDGRGDGRGASRMALPRALRPQFADGSDVLHAARFLVEFAVDPAGEHPAAEGLVHGWWPSLASVSCLYRHSSI